MPMSDQEFLGQSPSAMAAPGIDTSDPSWTRGDGTKKGMGFLGPLQQTEGQFKGQTSTELSIGVTIGGKEMDVPSMVPTLSPAEIKYLTTGGDPRKNPDIIRKATDFAEQRLKAGKSVFAEPGDYPKSAAPGIMTDDEFLGPDAGKTSYDKALGVIKQTGANAAAVADMVLGVPGMVVGAGADIGARAVGLATGEPRREAAKGGLAAGEKVAGTLGSPVGKLMRYFGYGDDYDKSDVNNVMQTFGKWLEKGGDWIEGKTGGALLKEDVQSLANTAMAAVGGRAVGAGVEAGVKALTAPKPTAPEPTLTPEVTDHLQGVDPVAQAQLKEALAGMTVEKKSQVKAIFDAAKKPLPEADLDRQFVVSLFENAKKGVTTPEAGKAALAGAAIGGAMLLDKEDAEKVGVGGLLAMGAVKGVGEGVWTKGAVERLASPLKDKIITSADAAAHGNRQLAAGEPLTPPPSDLWADRAITKHLNKHFGAETDPLNSVKIPMLGDEVTWGQVADKVVKSAKIPVRLEMMKEGKAMPGEAVWDIETGHRPYAGAPHLESLTSYLSHVGDYLREFVPPEKLGQYDLVRAVKETARQDEIQAAKMAKARASGEGTTLHKTYPDGMKWVEVQSPDALKNEGDVMGHCVGGYCEAVHAGESKIYSLRDAKGMSHVTVEVEPAGRRMEGRSLESLEQTKEPRILQIKGKQNRAPVAQYLPYVQDFVKSGKWGDVGDFENTGLVDVRNPRQGQRGPIDWTPDLARQAETKFGRYADPKEFRDFTDPFVLADLSRGERGQVDPKLITKMAAIGTGVALGVAAADDKTTGAIMGGLAGAGLARFGPAAGTAMWEATKLAVTGKPWAAVKELVPGPISKAFADDPRIRVKSEMDAAEVAIRRDALERSRLVQGVAKDVPDESKQIAISHWLEGDASVQLSPKETAAAKRTQAYFDRMGVAGKDANVIDDLITNYVTHVYSKEALPLVAELMQARKLGATATPFGKQRVGPPTIAEVNAFMASKGRPPIMSNILDIVEQYGNSVSKAIANKSLVDSLKSRVVPIERAGKKSAAPLIASAIPGKAPAFYQPFGKQGLVAHPDIIPALRFAFENENPLLAVRAVEAINTAAKRSAVSFSLFHAKNLVDAFAGAAKPKLTHVATGAALGAMVGAATSDDPITYAMIGAGLGMTARGLKIAAQAAAPKLFGENRYVKALREGDPALAKTIDLSMEGGLMYSLKGGPLAAREMGQDFYSGLKWLQGEADRLVPGAGLAVKGLEKLNHAVDGFMWERLHTGLKLEIFAEKYETLMLENAKAHAADPRVPLFTEKAIAERAASFTNDIFGGINWRRVAEESKTRWGRDLAMSSYSPAGQRVLRLAMFAPDWTISTTRAALKAFGPLVGQEAGTGIRGLMSPRTVTDLHRQYMLRSALYYAMVGDGLNYALTGHHLWQNKDPTYIEMGDGRKIQYSKHTLEPYHWLMNPAQQALNKMGQIPREITAQTLGVEYLAPRPDRSGGIVAGPKMQEGRIAHLGKTLSPIGVQQLAGGGAKAGLMGAVGMPIYGKSEAELAAAKERRRLRRAEGK